MICFLYQSIRFRTLRRRLKVYTKVCKNLQYTLLSTHPLKILCFWGETKAKKLFKSSLKSQLRNYNSTHVKECKTSFAAFAARSTVSQCWNDNNRILHGFQVVKNWSFFFFFVNFLPYLMIFKSENRILGTHSTTSTYELHIVLLNKKKM